MRSAVISVFSPREVSVFITHGEGLKTEGKFESLELAKTYLAENNWVQAGSLIWIERTLAIPAMTFMPRTEAGVVVDTYFFRNLPYRGLPSYVMYVFVNVASFCWVGHGIFWTFCFTANWAKGDPILRLCVPSFMSAELCVGPWGSMELARDAAFTFLDSLMRIDEFRDKINTDLYRVFQAHPPESK